MTNIRYYAGQKSQKKNKHRTEGKNNNKFHGPFLYFVKRKTVMQL